MKSITILTLVSVVAVWLLVIDVSMKPKKNPFTWTDENGCQYLVKNGGLTPRNNPNGTQICKK